MESTNTSAASAGVTCSSTTRARFTKLRSGTSFRKTPFDEALAAVEGPLKELGETLETAYDDAYVSRKEAMLEAAGIEILRLRVVPDGGAA